MGGGIVHRLTQLWSSRPDTQPRIIGSSDVTADIVDQPPGDCDGRPKGRLAPVRLGIAPRRGRAAVCGQVFAVAVSDGDVQSATAPSSLGKPVKHRAEILARNMNQ